MKNFRVLALFSLLVALFIWSCSKQNSIAPTVDVSEKEETLVQEPSFEIVNGVLKFNTVDEYRNMFEYLRTGKVENMNEWIASKGLINLESTYNKLYEAIFEIENEDDVLSFIRQNDKYISIKTDSDGEQEVVPTTDIFENVFANEDFIFMIGDYIYDVREHKKGNVQTTFRNCGSYISDMGYRNKNHCYRGRRMKLEVAAVTDYFQAKHTHENSARIRGQRKWTCVWANYRTDLDFDTTPIVESVFDGQTFDAPLTSFNGALNCTNCYSHLFEVETEVDNDNTQPDITKASAKATSRGIGSQFVVIQCN